jgi:hypothetical protein
MVCVFLSEHPEAPTCQYTCLSDRNTLIHTHICTHILAHSLMVTGINVIDPVMHSVCWVPTAVDVRTIKRKNSIIFLNDKNVEMYT